jgi:hypothetical protein
MNVQDLKPFECVRLTEGTGGSSMHVIKGKEDEIFITRDTEVKRVKPDPSNENNQYVYEHFSKISGEKADTKTVITGIRTTSHDWYSLLMCELIYKGLNHEED